MMKEVNNGFFVRVEAGKFAITESGVALIGAGPKENEPPEGGSETGEVDASSDSAD